MELPTILVTLNGLDIGGAETHVVVLCKYLKSLGYNVVIASYGGVYEKEIKEYGIKHYKVCLHTKNPWVVLQSIAKLIKIVRTEKVDLIHAHARIPAFICNIVRWLTGVKFITTAHAKFRTNFLLKHLSVWGQRTIAVSEDIRDYLACAFNVNKDNITVITNGIDTEQYKSGIDYADLENEFGIDNTYKKVVWVSRLYNEIGGTIDNLIDSAKELSEKFDKLVIFVVGSGEKFEEIRDRAQRINGEIGKVVVRVLGRRLDINKILNFSDVFVGISRAALEAMACEKPVVLAGSWGFVGVLDEKNAEAAQADNFTGRNSTEEVTSKNITSEIDKILSMSDEQRSKLGKFGRNIVLENYSALNMAQKTAEIYNEMLKER